MAHKRDFAGTRSPAGAGVRLSDVAREAGVSLATASRAINGSTDRTVRADLRDRVLAAAERLGYSPDANAQAMARGQTATVGLIVHDIADPYFASIAAGVTEGAERAGLVVTLANTHHGADRELRLVQTLQSQRARAIILAGGREDDQEGNDRLRAALSAYRDRGGTVAAIGQPILGVSTVSVANRDGAAALAASLHDLGYRRFGVLAGPEKHLTARDRSAGFLDALSRLGVEVPGEAVVRTAFTRDGGYEGCRELLRRHDGIELVFAVNDVMAVGAMTAAREQGARVPDQLAVAGFDDIFTLRDVFPPLTTVHLPLEEMGRLAMSLALDPDRPVGEIAVSGRVVLRQSTPRRH